MCTETPLFEFSRPAFERQKTVQALTRCWIPGKTEWRWAVHTWRCRGSWTWLWRQNHAVSVFPCWKQPSHVHGGNSITKTVMSKFLGAWLFPVEEKKLHACLRNDSCFTGNFSMFQKHTLVAIQDFCFHFAPLKCTWDTDWQCLTHGINTWRINMEWKFNYRYITHENKLCVAKNASLTSNVLHGDGAGSSKLSWHPEGFVTELLVHQSTFWRGNRLRLKIKHSKRLQEASEKFWYTAPSDSPPSLAVFSSKWTEYREKMATATRRIL